MSSSEISLLVPPSGVSSRRSRTPNQGVEQPYEVISSAWRGRCCRRGAFAPRRRVALRHPDTRHPGRAQRAGPARQEPDRVGQDTCLCNPDRPAPERRRGEALRADPRADARARDPGRGGVRAARQGAGPAGRRRLRRHAARRPTRRRRRTRTSSSPRPVASRTWPSGSCSSSTRSGSSSSTRPTACSTWASSRRSTRSSSACPASARRCSSRPRSTARSVSSPARTRSTRAATTPSSRRTSRAARPITSSSRSRPTTRSRRWSSCSRRSAASSSSSPGRSAAPTGSCRS